MNDYIAKPVDEKLLYNKIVALIKKESKLVEPDFFKPVNKYKSIDLNYLTKRTKSNQNLMLEMISLYLSQTPILISEIKQSLEKMDWRGLNAAIHKIIPSFAIVGINPEYLQMAIKVKEYSIAGLEASTIINLVHEIEKICMDACEELEMEVQEIKKTESWKNQKN